MSMLLRLLLLPSLLSFYGGATPARQAATPAADPPAGLRAKYLVTVADDFIVDVYHNGRAVPDSKRVMQNERFGATVEQINVEVRRGDWLVFHVVNNRMRWGGAYYFALAGCLERDAFGFVSSLDTGDWCACDDPRDADRFITERSYLRNRPAQKVYQPWSEGDGWMRAYAGEKWAGAPLWGSSRSTWIKVLVE